MTQQSSSVSAPVPPAAAPSDAFVLSAYAHCARLAIGLLTSRGSLTPQLFLVGAPAQGDDAGTSRVARAGEQALAAFHADEASAGQLPDFIRSLLDPQHERGAALARQLGTPLVLVYACHALAPADTPLPQVDEGLQPVVRPDGRSECLLVSVHTSRGSASAWSPLGRAADGELRLAIGPLPALEAAA